MRVSRLFVYPVKSLRGVEVSTLDFDERGPHLDRRWMLVDAEDRFLTQRTLPALARLAPRLTPDALEVEVADAGEAPAGGPRFHPAPLAVPLDAVGAPRRVTVWRDAVEALDAGAEAARWFSEVLGTRCRLVGLGPAPRLVDERYRPRPDAQVGFADGFPCLLVNQASLDELCTRLPAPVPVERFRPNVVVAAERPWAEDGWGAVQVGGVVLDAVKPNARCVVVDQDHRTGAPDGGVLDALATDRRTGLGVIFGQNCVHRGPGSVTVGDAATLVAAAAPLR